MIVLDTNVISEVLKPSPEPRVVEWLNDQNPNSLYLTVINWAELRTGVELLPTGKRKTALNQALLTRIRPAFEHRILELDMTATEFLVTVLAKAHKTGRAVQFADAAIAAIALKHRFAVATRDEGGFAASGVVIINPWTAP